MSRSSWKFIISPPVSPKNKKIWERYSKISENFLNSHVWVYTGSRFVKIFVNRERLGFNFGDFCYTRKPGKKVFKKGKKK